MAQQRPTFDWASVEQRPTPPSPPPPAETPSFDWDSVEKNLTIRQPQLTPGQVQTALDLGLPIVSSFLGGALGARHLSPRGAQAGATLGGMVGEGAAMALYPAFGIEAPTGDEVATRLALAGVIGGAGEFGSQKAVNALSRVLSGTSKKVDAAGRKVAEMARTAVPAPGTKSRFLAQTVLRNLGRPGQWVQESFLPASTVAALPSDVSMSPWVSLLENIAESGFGGEALIRGLKDARTGVLDKTLAGLTRNAPDKEVLGQGLTASAATELGKTAAKGQYGPLSRMPATPQATGEVLQQGLQTQEQALKGIAQRMYDKALDLPEIPLEGAKGLAKNILGSNFAQESAGKLLPTLHRIAAAGDEALDPRVVALLERQGMPGEPLPKTVPAEDAQKLMTYLKRVMREESGNADVKRIATQLVSTIERSMDDVGSALTPDSKHFYDLGRDIWRGKSEIFGADAVEQALKGRPTAVADSLLTQTPEALAELQRAAPPATWKQMEQATMDRLLLTDGGLYSEAKLGKALEQHGERLKVLLGKDARAALNTHRRRLVEASADKLATWANETPSTFATQVQRMAPEDLRVLTNTLSPARRQALSESTIQTLLQKGAGTVEGAAAAAGDDVLTGAQVEGRLKQLGSERFKELVTPDAAKGFDEFFAVLKRIEQNKGDAGRMMTQMRQSGAVVQAVQTTAAAAGALAGAASGDWTSGALMAGTILLGPRQIAKLIASPAGRNWLIQGIQTPPGTAAAARLTTQIMGFLAKDIAAEPMPASVQVSPEALRGGR